MKNMKNSEKGGATRMEIIVEGKLPEETDGMTVSGTCTQEPGDNCWLHLD